MKLSHLKQHLFPYVFDTPKNGKQVSLLKIRLYSVLFLLFLIGSMGTAKAATFDLASKPDGTIIPGARVEGDIIPGDAQRLLDFYKEYGTNISPLYLRSRGGDVEEAMRMGAIIRRLRLETNVLVWDTGSQPFDPIKVDNSDDHICASACFLIYAAGATRFGNYLALHRPYISRKDALSLSDLEYEATQKEITPKVKAYLSDMEIDQYWIDRMFATNSQEGYMPTWGEADNKVRHLMGMVPSLEEVVLSKCNEDPDVDKKIQAFRNSRTGPLTPADEDKMKEIMFTSEVFSKCEDTVLSDMQREAFTRENASVVESKCQQYPVLSDHENSILKTLIAKGDRISTDESAQRNELLKKYGPGFSCRNDAIYKLQFEATSRYSKEIDKNRPSVSTKVAEDFDAQGLSGSDVADRGKKAYEAQRWDIARRWFQKAADLGNAEGMQGMSWIYYNGRGVPENKAEGLRWMKMAAEHGNVEAIQSIAYDYENGKDMPTDYTEAMKWYTKAANMGSNQAMVNIGNIYQNGEGVPSNYTEAMSWYKKAMDAGNKFALFEIGSMYEFGYGVPKDEKEARVWMEKAAVSQDDTMTSIVANQWLVDHPPQ